MATPEWKKVKIGDIPSGSTKDLPENVSKKDAMLWIKEKRPGSVVKSRPAPSTPGYTVIILILAALELMYSGMFVMGIIGNWDQQWLSFYLGMASMLMAFIIYYYLKGFVPKTLVVKHRLRKVIPNKDVSWWSFK